VTVPDDVLRALAADPGIAAVELTGSRDFHLLSVP
jgi:hypothetical protein